VPPDSAVRRRPAQARSRERVDRVLAAAAALLGEAGVGALSMTAIAERAGMALTAVYRYFPNREAVVRELALRTFAHDTETLLTGEVPAGATVEELIAAGVEEFWRRHRDEPYRLRLRAAVHADAELAALDLAESRVDARVIAEAVAGLTGRTDVDVLERRALLVVELIDSLMSLVGRVEPAEAQPLVDEFVAMAVRALTA
jgi:AcrR family transcriptional regulator